MPTTTSTTRRDGRDEANRTKQRTGLRLDDFTWVALERESATMGVTCDELATFAIAYFLADADSGRIARRLPDALIGRR